MFKLFQKLFGHKPVPTPPKEDNLAASSFDIAELVKDSLVSIYEKENGRPATESEKKHIRDAMDGIITPPIAPNLKISQRMKKSSPSKGKTPSKELPTA